MKKEPLYLLDLLKICVLVAITTFHANEFIFFVDGFHLAGKAWVDVFYYFSRAFSMGGQILVFMIYFLFAYTAKPKKSLLLISLFALFGQGILTVVFAEGRSILEAFTWDIYIYLAFCNVILVLLPDFIKKHWLTIFASFLFLIFPQGFFQNLVGDGTFWVILTGKMQGNNVAAWPLLPWFFLTTFAYGFGIRARDYEESLKRWHSFENVLWPLLFLVSLPVIGAYYWLPIGPTYYQFVFNRPPHIFWGNFWVFLFWIRLSFLPGIQNYLSTKRFAKFISGLSWCRHLGIVYLISVIYLGIGMNFSDAFEESPHLFDVYFLGNLVVSELLGRGVIKVLRMLKK